MSGVRYLQEIRKSPIRRANEIGRRAALSFLTALSSLLNRVPPSGNILYAGRCNFTFDDFANGGDAQTTARVGALNIYDPATGKFERVWDALKFWDATAPAQRVEWSAAADVSAWTRVNSLSLSPGVDWIISSRSRRQVVSISPDFKTIHRQLGGPDSDFDFPDPPIYASAVSGACRLDNGSAPINFGISDDSATIPTAVIEADAEGRDAFRLGRVDIRLKRTIAASSCPISTRQSRFQTPSFPRKRESRGDAGLARRVIYPKSSTNSERQIPSPFMGEG